MDEGQSCNQCIWRRLYQSKTLIIILTATELCDYAGAPDAVWKDNEMRPLLTTNLR